MFSVSSIKLIQHYDHKRFYYFLSVMCKAVSVHLRSVEYLHREARDPGDVPVLAADFVRLDGLGEVSGDGGQQHFGLGLTAALGARSPRQLLELRGLRRSQHLLRIRRTGDLDRICGDRESDHRVFRSGSGVYNITSVWQTHESGDDQPHHHSAESVRCWAHSAADQFTIMTRDYLNVDVFVRWTERGMIQLPVPAQLRTTRSVPETRLKLIDILLLLLAKFHIHRSKFTHQNPLFIIIF